MQYGSGCGLTFSSSIYQYKEAAGLDLSEEQLAIRNSPILYVGCSPLMTGSCFGKATEYKKGKNGLLILTTVFFLTAIRFQHSIES